MRGSFLGGHLASERGLHDRGLLALEASRLLDGDLLLVVRGGNSERMALGLVCPLEGEPGAALFLIELPPPRGVVRAVHGSD
jgi:hypothetical protein